MRGTAYALLRLPLTSALGNDKNLTMLIIEIALGIVLGFLILAYLPEILVFGIKGLVSLAVIVLVIFLGYLIYENHLAVIKLLIPLILLFILYVVAHFTGIKISEFTVEKWGISVGQLFGFVFSFSIIAIGVFIIINTVIENKSDGGYLIGTFPLIIGFVIAKGIIREMKKEKKLSAIRASYEE